MFCRETKYLPPNDTWTFWNISNGFCSPNALKFLPSFILFHSSWPSRTCLFDPGMWTRACHCMLMSYQPIHVMLSHLCLSCHGSTCSKHHVVSCHVTPCHGCRLMSWIGVQVHHLVEAKQVFFLRLVRTVSNSVSVETLYNKLFFVFKNNI